MLKLMKQNEQLMTTYGKMLQYVEQMLKTNENILTQVGQLIETNGKRLKQDGEFRETNTKSDEISSILAHLINKCVYILVLTDWSSWTASGKSWHKIIPKGQPGTDPPPEV